MPRNLQLTSLDKNHLLLDVGLTYTKCGLVTEAAPRHIVPTPFTAVRALRNSILDLSPSTFAQLFPQPSHLSMEKSSLYLECEEFLSQIFYHLMQVKPADKGVVIVESFMGLRAVYEMIAHVLFRSFGVSSVYFVLANALPIYCSGMDSGIVVDVGF